MTLKFQSTLPSQGATRTHHLRMHHHRRFQSTLPSQGATGKIATQSESTQFQSTLPSQGATMELPPVMNENYIFQSTLPSQGATHNLNVDVLTLKYFNPRSPHRERRYLLYLIITLSNFNPRSPHRERRKNISDMSSWRDNFNPRSPHRERHHNRFLRWMYLRFQSTLPSQGATLTTNRRTLYG